MGLKENASAKLNAAYVDAQRTINSTCAHKDFIDFVIDNTHLTYKYVLFTAILAKATDESIVKATTEYSTHIHASVESGNVFACQFHPEKSSRWIK